MTYMNALRNKRFKRWVAGGLAVTWLFTVLACAMDGELVAAEPAHATQLATGAQTGSHHNQGGESPDDGCCQWQATSIPSFNVVKLPNVLTFPAIVSLVVLFMLSLPTTLLRIGVVPDEHPPRWRFEFLAHTVQAQAPPR